MRIDDITRPSGTRDPGPAEPEGRVACLITTAQGRLRGYAVFEHPHLAEFADIVTPVCDYVGAANLPRGPAEYHQHYDVAEAMPDVAFV